MVFQSFNLFPHLTALENVIEAPIVAQKRSKAEARKRGLELLDRVGLKDRADAYPRQLSGGQQQRVAIARALALDPKILLFDEPTSALDPELVNEVLDVIRELAKSGTTLIIVTHEMGFARDVADTVVFMDQGQIVESGTPQDIFANPREERTRSFFSKVHRTSFQHLRTPHGFAPPRPNSGTRCTSRRRASSAGRGAPILERRQPQPARPTTAASNGVVYNTSADQQPDPRREGRCARSQEPFPRLIGKDGKLTVATTAGSIPLSFHATDDKTPIGVEVDIAQLVADKLGLELDLQVTSWENWPLKTQSGDFEAVFSNVGINAAPREAVRLRHLPRRVHGLRGEEELHL